MAEEIEDRLRDLGYELPDVPQPAGSYVPAAFATGALLFTAGQLPFKEGKLPYTGLHTRSAVGVAELPLDAPVEGELVVELANPQE